MGIKSVARTLTAGVALLLVLGGLGCLPGGGGGALDIDALDRLHAEDLSGHLWDKQAMQGKVVLIDFWATWCGPCVGELPYLKTAYERYRGQGFEILGISLDGPDRHAFRQWLETNGVTWPQVHEGQQFDSPTAVDFGVSAIPRNILLDREGKVIGTNLRGPRLVQAVERAMSSS